MDDRAASPAKSFPRTRMPSRSEAGSPTGSKMKKSSSLPTETVEYLKAWMMSPEHVAHPYPTDAEKAKIMEDTGIELKQLTNWFVNNRKRYWKPRVEARLREQTQTSTKDTTKPTPQVTLLKPRSVSQMNEKQQVKAMPRHVSLVDLVSTSVLSNVEEPVMPKEVKGSESSVQGSASLALEQSKNHNSRSFRKKLASFIDEHSSVVSFNNESGSESQSQSDDDSSATGQATAEERFTMHTKTEHVDVHILKPSGSNLLPQFSDVTVLPHVPSERVLRTYWNCEFTFQYQAESLATSNADLMKQISSKRDAEIAKVKKHFLSLYLRECEAMADAIAMGKPTSMAPAIAAVTPPRKRTFVDEEDEEAAISTPRPKFRRVSVDLWKKACEKASHVYHDEELPTLEEAAQLFGFAQRAQHDFSLI